MPGAGKWRIFKSSALVAVAMLGANAAGYLLVIVGTRILSPDEFGALGTLLNLTAIGGVLPLAIMVVGARLVVVADSLNQGGVGSRILRFSLTSGLVFAAVGLLLTPWLSALLNQSTSWNIVMIALMMPALAIHGAQYGIAQGRQSHGRLATVMALHGVLR